MGKKNNASLPMGYDANTDTYTIGEVFLSRELVEELARFQQCGEWAANSIQRIALTCAAHEDFREKEGETKMRDFYEASRDAANFFISLENYASEFDDIKDE